MSQSQEPTPRRPIRRRRPPRARGRNPLLSLFFVAIFFLSVWGAWGVLNASEMPPVFGPPVTPQPTISGWPGAGPPAELPTSVYDREVPVDVPADEMIDLTEPPDLATVNPELAGALQHILDRKSAGPHNPGMVMLLDIPGQGRWIGASGFSDREAQVPMVPEDRFRIASVTKTFVATVVLQLVQEGRLTLDDTVEQWLPGLVPNGHTITVRQLLNHTSGLYDYLDGAFERVYFAEPPRIWMPQELVWHGVGRSSYFAPGTPGRWRYSNTNYILLGMIIEQASGSTLTHELRSRLFEPLQLRDTFLEDYEEIPGGFVHGYIASNDYTEYSLSTWAAGGIVSNARDLSVFFQALFTGRLLDEPMMQEMLAFATMSGYPVYGLGVARSVEGLTIATQGVVPTDMSFETLWGHTGGLSGFKSVVGYQPGSGVTVVVLMNQMSVPIIPVLVEGLHTAGIGE
jgi:D-alanyl-D-alanine carboxypeptidase